MVVAEACAAVGNAASATMSFVRGEWWSDDKRPADHPMACDCRKSLHLCPDMKYTAKDIAKLERQASRWWHPDKNQGVDRGITDFHRIAQAFKSTQNRSRYAAEVEAEEKLMKDMGQEVDWRTFNERFFRQLEGRQRTQAPGREPAQGEMSEFCHVFLDASGSMANMSKDGVKSCLEAGKAVLHDLFSRFVDSATAVHLIGSKSESKCLIPHNQDISFRDEDWLLRKWTAECRGTYLWQYIHDEIKDFKDCKHEVVIITDGMDNESEGEFRGMSGFNGLMKRMKGGRVRISVYLLGKSVSKENARIYHDVCIATGGFFAAELEAVPNVALENFVTSLLMPEGERDFMAIQQQLTYQDMLANGEAQRFDWHLHLLNEADSERHQPGPGPSGQFRHFAPPRRAQTELAPQVKVRIHGLQTSADLNGCTGTCEKWLALQDRWEVKLECGSSKALRAANLVVCRA